MKGKEGRGGENYKERDWEKQRDGERERRVERERERERERLGYYEKKPLDVLFKRSSKESLLSFSIYKADLGRCLYSIWSCV